MTDSVSQIGQDPFGICPNPRFMFFNEKLRGEHEILLPSLRQGIGCALVDDGSGIGKTMLLHSLVAELKSTNRSVAYISYLGGPTLEGIGLDLRAQVGYLEYAKPMCWIRWPRAAANRLRKP